MNRKHAFGLALGVFLLMNSCQKPDIAQPTPTASFTPTAAPTLSPTITSTARPPMLSANEKVPCRTGPDESYDLVINLPAAQKYVIVEKTETFWKVRLPDKAECWVADEKVNIDGNESAVPTISPTQTPIPAPPAAPDELSLISMTCSIDNSTKPKQFVNKFRLGWTDESNNEDGFRVYRDGNLIAEVSANKTDLVDVVVALNNRVHYYYVASYNKLGVSKSDTITFSCGK